MSTPALDRATEALDASTGLGDDIGRDPLLAVTRATVSAALHDPEWLTVVLHDADCPDRTCEPGTMGRYRRQADAVRAAILGPDQ